MTHQTDTDQPRYHHIAARLAYQIATGRLSPGARLPSLRQAQREWEVHFHTIRRAYQRLHDAGLVTITPRGNTYVSGGHTGKPATVREAVAAFLAEVAVEFDASAAEVRHEIDELEGGSAAVVECSTSLATSIARQFGTRWQANLRPRPLSDEGDPSPILISTWFHAHELRTRIQGQDAMLYLVRIGLARHLLQRLSDEVRRGRLRRMVLCDTDEVFAQNTALELRNTLGSSVSISIVIPEDIDRFLSRADPETVKLVSPRHWDRLPARFVGSPGIMALEYQVDRGDVEEIGRRLGWPTRTPGLAL